MFSRWIEKIYQGLLPCICSLCGSSSSNHINLCNACQKELPWLTHTCYRCALPLSEAGPEVCGECLKKPVSYNTTIALFYYHFPIDRLISLLKFHNKIHFANLLGSLMAKKVVAYYAQDSKPALIIPMPLHQQRLKERGYNQAVELARPIAKKLEIPLSLTSCRRVLNTAQQSLVPADKRGHNVQNAFSVQLPFMPEHVAIVDDVMTTGSTVAELARTLRRAGVKRIDVWCCARTVLG